MLWVNWFLSPAGMTPVSCDRVVNIQKPLAGLKVFTYDGTMGRVTSKYIAKGTKIVEQTDGGMCVFLNRDMEI